MFKDTDKGKTIYCTHPNENASGVCDKCLGKHYCERCKKQIADGTECESPQPKLKFSVCEKHQRRVCDECEKYGTWISNQPEPLISEEKLLEIAKGANKDQADLIKPKEPQDVIQETLDEIEKSEFQPKLEGTHKFKKMSFKRKKNIGNDEVLYFIPPQPKECNHQFWRDRNPEQCLNCGKTGEEIMKGRHDHTEAMQGFERQKDGTITTQGEEWEIEFENEFASWWGNESILTERIKDHIKSLLQKEREKLTKNWEIFNAINHEKAMEVLEKQKQDILKWVEKNKKEGKLFTELGYNDAHTKRTGKRDLNRQPI